MDIVNSSDNQVTMRLYELNFLKTNICIVTNIIMSIPLAKSIPKFNWTKDFSDVLKDLTLLFASDNTHFDGLYEHWRGASVIFTLFYVVWEYLWVI